MKSLLVFLLFHSPKIALSAEYMILNCKIENVPTCVGDVPYHCGAPGYKVVCNGSVRANSLENALFIKEQIEQGKISYQPK
jgi:hypothetical protein